MKRLVPILTAALVLRACGDAAPNSHNMAGSTRNATAARYENVFQLPVLPGRPGAAYFSIPVPAEYGALVGATSPQAGRIEMHQTSQEGSVTRMRPIQRIAPRLGQLILMPRDQHLMLFDVDQSLSPGDTARLVLRFEGGQTITLEARVYSGENAHVRH